MPATQVVELPTEPLLRVEHAQLGYTVDKTLEVAVQDVSFEVRSGEKIMLLGPSGCGKSTLLKAIGGFHEMSGGEMSSPGVDRFVPGPDRAMVFQEFDQLFPWRTVEGNVTYPLLRNGRSKAEARDLAGRFLEMTNLSHAKDSYPHQLSGGMKQRVAIARALALAPMMLLFDEPFAALDALTRSRLQRELANIVRKTQVTVIFVTHSIEEAIILGDRVIVLGGSPSTVREIVPVADEHRTADSEKYLALRKYLRGLLDHDGSESEADG